MKTILAALALLAQDPPKEPPAVTLQVKLGGLS
jgi:hypothetical protein